MAKDYLREVEALLGHHRNIVDRLEITRETLAAIDAAGLSTITGTLAAPAAHREPFVTIRRVAGPPAAKERPAKRPASPASARKPYNGSNGTRALMADGQTVQARTLAVIRAAGRRMSPVEIVAAVGGSKGKRNTIYGVLHSLKGDGVLSQDSAGNYGLSDGTPPPAPKPAPGKRHHVARAPSPGTWSHKVLHALAEAQMPIRVRQIGLLLGEQTVPQGIYTAMNKLKTDRVVTHRKDGAYERGPNFPHVNGAPAP